MQNAQALHQEMHATIKLQRRKMDEMVKAETEKDQLIADLREQLQQSQGNTSLFSSVLTYAHSILFFSCD